HSTAPAGRERIISACQRSLKLKVTVVDQLHAFRPGLDGGELEFCLGKRRKAQREKNNNGDQPLGTQRRPFRFFHTNDLSNYSCGLGGRIPSRNLQQAALKLKSKRLHGNFSALWTVKDNPHGEV